MMKKGSENKTKTTTSLGLVIITLIVIILLLNFTSFLFLDSANKRQQALTHSFNQVLLFEKLESQIHRQFKELADFIIMGGDELQEFEEYQQKSIKTFGEIESFIQLDSEHETRELAEEWKQLNKIKESYITLNSEINQTLTNWKKTNDKEILIQLQHDLEDTFEENFIDFLQKSMVQEMKEVERVNERTEKEFLIKTIVAWFLILASLVFSVYAYRNLISSTVSRKELEAANSALTQKIQEKEVADKKVFLERQNLYNMLDSLPMAFHLQAPDYTVPFANKVFRERFGDPKNRMCHDLMFNRSQPCEVCSTFRVFDHKRNEVSIWEAQDGRTYITVCTPFTDIDGSPLVMEMAMDITEQEEAKKEAILAKEEAEKANIAKSEFLARMSHELRTPMNAILGFGQLLIMDQENPLKPIQQNNIQHILKAGQHLLELISEVLDLSKIESGSVSLSTEEVQPGPLVSEVLELLKPMREEKGISLHSADLEDFEFSVLADRVRLKQVLMNLVSNAIKYNRSGGSISIAFNQLDNHKIQINIHDTGIGIPAESLTEIFKPFSRVDTDNGSIEGTGIGLTISQDLMKLMNGSLEVQSAVGKGSCFSLTLPKSNGHTSLVQQTPNTWPKIAAPTSHKNDFTVLYIEDNPANMALVSSILFRHNLKLLQAPDARLGVELAKAHKPDLVLMDINLPGMDGYEALKVIRTEASLDSTPVIALSANCMEPDIKRGLSTGFSDYICKPIHVASFLKKVNEYLV